ncbi:ggdef family domain protein, partial [Vibrio parahaemolyticus V-223/04]
MPSVPSPA